MVWVCQDRPGGSQRRVQKREGAQMLRAKRFLHLYLRDQSIEPGTGVCICIVCLSWSQGSRRFRIPVPYQ